MQHLRSFIFPLISTVLILASCAAEDPSGTTPRDIPVPEGFYPMNIPADNPLTEEGIALGRKLFYDPLLSKNALQSCGSCHHQAAAFTDNGNQFSTGVEGLPGTRNAMALINLGWENDFFWDGRAGTLESQILHPVRDPLEMNTSWTDVMARLNDNEEYRDGFRQVFQSDVIDSTLVTKAIAQFLRTMISADSRYDRFARQEISLNESELRGLDIFRTERGDCFHCHAFQGTGLFTDLSFKNNGLDSDAGISDPGRQQVTGSSNDRGKFKVPTLRNIALTAPYMHDGRFATLEEVIDHYDMGGNSSSTVDPLMKHVGTGLNLTLQDKQDLLSFLQALTDENFIADPQFSEP